MVVEVSYVEWTPDGLLRHVDYLGERKERLATEVRRSRPHASDPRPGKAGPSVFIDYIGVRIRRDRYKPTHKVAD